MVSYGIVRCGAVCFVLAVKVRQDVEGFVMVWRGKPRQLRRVAFRYVNVGIGKARKLRKEWCKWFINQNSNINGETDGNRQ